MLMKIPKNLPLLLSLVCLGWVEQSKAITELCTSDGINGTCEAEGRTCLKIDGIEQCDQCLAGNIPNFTSPDGECISIRSITFDDFERAFNVTLEENLANKVRLALIVAIAERVSTHNAQFPPPDFYLTLNHLSALSEKEIRKRNGYRSENDAEDSIPYLEGLEERRLQNLPESVDWVTAGAVTSVKNQEQCGCCYTVSTVGAIEGIASIRSNYAYLQSLSFQQLVSCDTSNQGCNGGSVTTALQYTEQETNNQYTIGGVTTYDQYPFVDQKGTTTTTCSIDSDKLAVQVNATRMVTKTNSRDDATTRIANMKAAVAKQPVSVLINANCPTFQSYSSGVLTSDGSCACSPSISNCIDHAVLLVGYDDTAPTPYWYVKNSWGTGWGEKGYVKFAQTATSSEWGLFGILAQGAVPTDAFNTTVEVASGVLSTYAIFPAALSVVSGWVLSALLG